MHPPKALICPQLEEILAWSTALRSGLRCDDEARHCRLIAA
jgi:hypothetical protein